MSVQHTFDRSAYRAVGIGMFMHVKEIFFCVFYCFKDIPDRDVCR